MSEIGTLPLPRQFLAGIRKYLFDNHLGFFAYILDYDKVIGGALFVGINKVLDIFMMSVDSDYLSKQPNSLMVFELLKYAEEKKYIYFNWQSSSSRNSGVYSYKKEWGADEGIHYYLTKIIEDISPLKCSSLETVRQKYKWHYVMPYKYLTCF